MRSRHLVDPEAEAQLDMVPLFDLTHQTLPELRRWMAENPAAAPAAPNVQVTEERIAGHGGRPAVRAILYRPARPSGPLPALLHCHAGGYVLGSPETHDAGNRFLAETLDCVVVSVDYRLPPETPFPGPVEDCYAGLRWLYVNAERFGVDPARIAVGGQSAGGGLAAALALLARDRGEVPILFQFLVYPMLDDRTGSTTDTDPHPYAGDFCWTRANNRFGWHCMLGEEPGGPGVSPYASPARATSLEGLPLAFIAVGALDLFVEESIEYARRLIRAGVPTELHVYPGGIHAFDACVGTSNQKAFDRASRDALDRAFRRRV